MLMSSSFSLLLNSKEICDIIPQVAVMISYQVLTETLYPASKYCQCSKPHPHHLLEIAYNLLWHSQTKQIKENKWKKILPHVCYRLENTLKNQWNLENHLASNCLRVLFSGKSNRFLPQPPSPWLIQNTNHCLPSVRTSLILRFPA